MDTYPSGGSEGGDSSPAFLGPLVDCGGLPTKVTLLSLLLAQFLQKVAVRFSASVFLTGSVGPAGGWASIIDIL